MSLTAFRVRRRLGHRWTISDRSPSPERLDQLRALQKEHQPRFTTAVHADAAITAKYRGEYHDFRSHFDAMVQAIRLAFISDAFFAQVCYRAEAACRFRGVPLLPSIFHRLSITSGQICIGTPVVMRPGVYIPHGQVVVDGLTLIERGAVLRPFVTIGLRDGMPWGPTIGPGAKIGTGAKVFGPVRVGAGAQVGANAVVTADVPDGATAVGIPARIVARSPAEQE